jgi:predicted nucleotidyltransferase component of viral defense system
MKDFLKQLVEKAENPVLAGNRVREYLQARILERLQEGGAFVSWVFHGGTALRFLYDLPRFSEDLDFSLDRPDDHLDFRSALRPLQTAFTHENYAVRVTVKESKTVKSAFLHFDGLPHELGLSPHTKQSLSIKVELDTRPPAGAGTASSLVRRHILLRLHHHDPATLLAGKLHALLARPFVKGRDVYDLVWYLSDRSWPEPNLVYLGHALAQTGWDGPDVSAENWRELVLGRLESADWRTIRRDVEPFLERPQELALLTLENLRSLLR